jgi:hypothetical protein
VRHDALDRRAARRFPGERDELARARRLGADPGPPQDVVLDIDRPGHTGPAPIRLRVAVAPLTPTPPSGRDVMTLTDQFSGGRTATGTIDDAGARYDWHAGGLNYRLEVARDAGIGLAATYQILDSIPAEA